MRDDKIKIGDHKGISNIKLGVCKSGSQGAGMPSKNINIPKDNV